MLRALDKHYWEDARREIGDLRARYSLQEPLATGLFVYIPQAQREASVIAS